MEKKQENCVTINVYVKCDKCGKEHKYECECDKSYPDQEYEKEMRESCVKINVFVDCDGKEKKEKKDK